MLSIYYASTGVEALRIGLNRAYDERRRELWWVLRLGIYFLCYCRRCSYNDFHYFLGFWACLLGKGPRLCALCCHVITIYLHTDLLWRLNIDASRAPLFWCINFCPAVKGLSARSRQGFFSHSRFGSHLVRRSAFILPAGTPTSARHTLGSPPL